MRVRVRVMYHILLKLRPNLSRFDEEVVGQHYAYLLHVQHRIRQTAYLHLVYAL